jgi:sporulation protein YlmC with PRC-barrel domain
MKLKWTLLLAGTLAAGTAFAADPVAPRSDTKDGWVRGYYNTNSAAPRTPLERAGDKLESAADRAGDKIDRAADRTADRLNTARDRAVVPGDKDAVVTDSINRVSRASQLIGMTVKNERGETLGHIDDLALDLDSGRINYVVLSSGGFLGVRDRLYAVPVAALRASTEAKTVVFDIDKETLKNTEGFVKNHWPEKADESLAERARASRVNDPSGALREPLPAKERPVVRP